MSSQFAFAGGGGPDGVGDGHGPVVAGAVVAGAALWLVAGAALWLVADAVVAGTVVGLVAGAAGAGAAVEAMPAAVGVGTAGPVVAFVAAGLPAAPVGAGVAGADRTLLPATATTPAAAPDMAGLADPAAGGVAQVPVRPATLLEALSMALMCGALRVAIPAARATVSSPIIGTRRARGCSAKPRC